MKSLQSSIKEFIQKFRSSKHAKLAVVAFLLLALPVIVLAVQKTQDPRSRAASPATPATPPNPDPTPTSTPSATPTFTPSPTPTDTPTPTLTPTPTRVPTYTPTPTPTKKPVMTPTPTPRDRTAPTVSITSPGSIVRKNSTVKIEATAKDTSGVTKVEFFIDGNKICTDTSSAYSCNWKVSASRFIPSYVITATAYDAAGNKATTSKRVAAL